MHAAAAVVMPVISIMVMAPTTGTTVGITTVVTIVITVIIIALITVQVPVIMHRHLQPRQHQRNDNRRLDHRNKQVEYSTCLLLYIFTSGGIEGSGIAS